MRVAHYRGEVLGNFAFQRNIVDLQIVFAQGERLFQHLPQIHFLFLRFALTRERKQILHNAVRPLRLLEHLPHIVGRTLLKARAFQQLRIAEDCRQRVVQLMRHSRNQLADRRHFFALQQLLLRPPQVFIRPASLFVELHLFDRRRQLPADGDQQVLIVAGVVPVFLPRNAHDANGFVLAPKHNPNPVRQPVGAGELHHRRGQMGHKVLGHDFGSRAHHQIAQPFRKDDFRHARARLAARPPTGAPPVGTIGLCREIDRPVLRAKQ